MRPGPNDGGVEFQIPKSETDPAGPDQVERQTKPRAKPFTGGYYWFPTPTPEGVNWSIITCRDLGCDPDAGHDADLSSTLFAVGAIRIAGVEPSDPSIRRALAFVERCQNWPEHGKKPDPTFDDGGFYFSPSDPVRNKAGVAGKDRDGRVRYHSYGSTTADGLRALLRCGLAPEHPRVVAARDWLERNFSASKNPGVFEPIREAEQDATYYYYAWSVAHALRALDVRKLRVDGREVDWAAALSEELIRRQRTDGSWSNRFTAAKEDDPLIATSFSAAALGIHRAMMKSAR